jgi:hypothetical protein
LNSLGAPPPPKKHDACSSANNDLCHIRYVLSCLAQVCLTQVFLTHVALICL